MAYAFGHAAWVRRLLEDAESRSAFWSSRFRRFDANRAGGVDLRQLIFVAAEFCGLLGVSAPDQSRLHAAFDSCDRHRVGILYGDALSSFFELMLRFVLEDLEGPRSSGAQDGLADYQPLEIHVNTMGGDTACISAMANSNLAGLQELIAAALGVPAKCQRLVFGEQLLETGMCSSTPLSSLGLTSGVELHVLVGPARPEWEIGQVVLARWRGGRLAGPPGRRLEIGMRALATVRGVNPDGTLAVRFLEARRYEYGDEEDNAVAAEDVSDPCGGVTPRSTIVVRGCADEHVGGRYVPVGDAWQGRPQWVNFQTGAALRFAGHAWELGGGFFCPVSTPLPPLAGWENADGFRALQMEPLLVEN